MTCLVSSVVLNTARTNIDIYTHTNLQILAAVKPLFFIPYERDRNSIDRKEIFAQVKEQLHAYRRATLYGIGGIG